MCVSSLDPHVSVSSLILCVPVSTSPHRAAEYRHCILTGDLTSISPNNKAHSSLKADSAKPTVSLVQQYEQFTILEEESIDSGFARFNTVITSLKALDEESKDLSSLALDELIGNIKVHEVVMEKDSEIYRGKKERVKSIALKSKKESSNDENSTSESDDEEYATKRRKKSFRQRDEKKGKSDQKRFRYGDPNHHIGDYLKPPRNKDQNAFIGGSWSDSENDAEDKTNDETYLMAQSSNEVLTPLWLPAFLCIVAKSLASKGTWDVPYVEVDSYEDWYNWFVILRIPSKHKQMFEGIDVMRRLVEKSIDSGFARFNTIITSLKTLDEGFSSKNYVRKFLRALHPKGRAKVMAIKESKDLSSLALDDLIGNLKVHEVAMEKDSEIYRGKKERVKSMAVRNFKNFFRRKGKFVRQPREKKSHSDKGMRRKERVTGNALDAVIQIISLEIVQSHLATKIKRPSLEVLGAIAKMTPRTKLTMKRVSWLNHQMRSLLTLLIIVIMHLLLTTIICK
ncbi:hypothetical protein Tco_1201156 [Tanacetum coccineum]